MFYIDIYLRAKRSAEYIIEHRCTIREAASFLGYGKSTLHTDITQRLKKEDFELYKKVKVILDENYTVKHLRGGESTKNKYLSQRS